MSFKLAARAVAVFSLPIRSGLSFWSLSRIQAPQRLFTGTFNYSASTEQQEALGKRRAKWREYTRSRRERLKSDPKSYEKVRQKGREYCQKLWATNESTRKKHTLCNWVTRVVANGIQVVWTTHEPVITTERVEHDCATCHRAYHNGVKLWWKRLSHCSEPKDSPPEDSAVYDCHNCFAKAWPENGMPKNYEYRTDKGGYQRLTRLW